ncbi:hypothetical protein ES319_D12G065900v1 [Gossypium barbadense]|uniref:Glycine-rich protein n=2 Tax=Gossypium TaxID=3633 RepID=A0A5J5NV72_GOSBA|nr:hypothetical protein ES319_D12G065900v1 [Gossypium barbadense]TYG40133.1 hypothetical protein ES288_D12G068700v1 [Gossypium darwinii]
MEVTREVRGLVLLAVVLMISPCSVDGMDGFERDNGVPGWSNASSSNMVSSENHAFIDNVQEKGTNFSQEIFVQSNGNVHSGGKGGDTGGGGGGGGGNGGGGSGNSNGRGKGKPHWKRKGRGNGGGGGGGDGNGGGGGGGSGGGGGGGNGNGHGQGWGGGNGGGGGGGEEAGVGEVATRVDAGFGDVVGQKNHLEGGLVLPY